MTHPAPDTAPAAEETKEVPFVFNKGNLVRVEAIIARYPGGRQQSAVMPLLTLAQTQNGGWLTRSTMDCIAAMLSMPAIRVYEVASFYTMYNLEPVGEHVIELCTTTPCWLRGSDAIVKACEDRLGIKMGQTTQDGKFTLREVECLGACVNAPMCSVREKYYEDLTPENVTALIDQLASGKKPRPGPQGELRKSSEPQGGATTLKEIKR